jgi:hypothetical protein
MSSKMHAQINGKKRVNFKLPYEGETVSHVQCTCI